jgi:2-polyprenyl-3-methyl-5-hydroxy-6-metoxy-1,4-benzoquinol methylase
VHRIWRAEHKKERGMAMQQKLQRAVAASSVPQAEFFQRTRCINCASSDLSELSRGKFTDKPLSDFLRGDPSGEDIMPYFQQAEWVLAECLHCGQVFHKNILTDEWNEIRFTQWMTANAIREFEARAHRESPFKETFNATVSHVSHVLRIEKLTRKIRKADEATCLLDFGCGFGDFISVCKSFGFDAVGVDRAAPRIEGAAVTVHPSLEPIGPKQFDAITMFEVLEHLDEPSQVLATLYPRLKTRGVLILETPDCEGVKRIHNRRDYLKVHPLEHINAFTHTTLQSIVERQGFKLIRRGPAFVTSEVFRLGKRIVKHAAGLDGKSTQLYFEKH